MKYLLVTPILVIFLSLSSCGSKVSNVSNGNCYRIEGDTVLYTCNNYSPENPRVNTGYTGPYNPKALNLYRPGRFESINSPVW